MRTDGVQVANEALDDARTVIAGRYGANYVPEKPRIYKTKAKNAQEAHEAGSAPTGLGPQPRLSAPGTGPSACLHGELDHGSG